MLREVTGVHQLPGRPRRRWFADDEFDLIVWLSTGGEIAGVQLCYDKDTSAERALSWFRDKGISHDRVDDGEGRPGRFKMSPVLLPDGPVDGAALLSRFESASSALEPEIVAAVRDLIVRSAPTDTAPPPTPAARSGAPSDAPDSSRRR